MKKRFTEEQIIGFLREAEAGAAVRERPDQGCAAKKVVSAPARRTLVREWIGRG
ncbi:hypothetical protein GGR61_003927, partial [Xanthomonas arboricola]|nr:hypothetical protein [Xanthomonas sp. 3058]